MSLRDRLRARSRPTATFDLRVEDDTAARAELAAAVAEGGDPERVDAAQDAVDACYETLQLTALPPADMEALIAAHPATDGSGGQWDPATFVPALLASCVDSDVTEDEWGEYVSKGPMSVGEVRDLFDKAIAVNYRGPDPRVPKGSTPTRS